MGVISHSPVLVPSIDAAFEIATALEEQQLASLDVEDLEAQLGELDGEVRSGLALICACQREKHGRAV